MNRSTAFELEEICIIGRTQFSSGIGAVSYAACELLARSFSVSIYPTDLSNTANQYITLPNGRLIKICKDLRNKKVFFFTDVLWNGSSDLNYTLLPKHGLKIAHVAYDSDALPEKWVSILNSYFNVVYFSHAYLEKIAIKSGVKIPVGTLPIGLPLEPLLTIPTKKHEKKIRFLSVAAFHRRKGHDILLEAFLKEFKQNHDVELIIHSNIMMSDMYLRLSKLLETENKRHNNVLLSTAQLSENEKNDLLQSADIFVNCSAGEGYSIGPREALALGKVLIVSDIDAHQDLGGVAGVFTIPTSIECPARYVEIDNQIFGKQKFVTVEETRKKLREAYNYIKYDLNLTSSHERRKRAQQFSFHYLTRNYAEVISPCIALFKKNAKVSTFTRVHPQCKEVAINELGKANQALNIKNRIILPAHDGGFFSVFNVFMSHLVWSLQQDDCHMVLPDWDVQRLLKRQNGKNLVSFCYGKPTDGNIWLKLFKPLYGLSSTEMNNEIFLYEKSLVPEHFFNEDKEPNLTYTRAYDLYKSASFKAFRRQYHRAFLEHVNLLPELKAEIRDFCQHYFSGKIMLAAHVKHPSHVIEQPNQQIASMDAYINKIKNYLNEQNIMLESESWGIFLATDQERVIAHFKTVFRGKVFCFDDVRRTKFAEDNLYESLSPEDKMKEGFQVQHLVATNPENWSTRMAWEVIRDALVMAECRVLFHIVSNVSTAVSYFNPEIDLIFVD